MSDIKVSLEKMQNVMHFLALELPEPVWDDVNKHWQNLKTDILNYCKSHEKPKIDTIQQQDKNGNWIEAVPLPLFMCEFNGCSNHVTLDDQYERIDKSLPNGWGDEPEFLCSKHAIELGRTKIVSKSKLLEWQVSSTPLPVNRLQLLILCVCYRGINNQTYLLNLLVQPWAQYFKTDPSMSDIVSNDLIQQQLLFADMSLTPSYREYSITSLGRSLISQLLNYCQLTCNQMIVLLDVLFTKNYSTENLHTATLNSDVQMLFTQQLIECCPQGSHSIVIVTDKGLDLIDKLCKN